MAAVPLVRELREREPNRPIVVTTTTATGAETVERMLGGLVAHAYFPFDLGFAIRRFIAAFAPRILIILETELWPNTIAECRDHGVPVVLVNARLSHRSCAGYARVGAVIRETILQLAAIVAQSDSDAARFRRLGASDEQLHVFGSLKFDLELPPSTYEKGAALRRRLGVNRPILTLASTRAGEESLLLAALRELKSTVSDLLVVVAPRHPDRFDEVADLLAGAGFALVRHSEQTECGPHIDIYLLDTMGELAQFYAASDIAFVGGSLLGHGGHNVLEPAALGVPVLTGPDTQNFADICEMMVAAGALKVVGGPDELVSQVGAWFGDSNERDRVGMIARRVVQTHGGATARTLALVERYLKN